jgi:hypothetical protein
LLFFPKVAREAHHTFRTHPDAAVGDFDVLEHVVTGNLLCWPSDVSSASGASAGM